MTDEHVRLKIKEALDATANDRHDAQKLLITWAVRDHALLLGMVKPHLKAVAAGLIDHTLRQKVEPSSPDSGPDHFSQSTIEDVLMTTSGGKVLEKRKNRNLPPPKSTERQASTMRRLAAAFTRKKS